MALYTIKQGDTLFLIAQRYLGNGQRYPEILDLNPQIYDPNLIRTGDLLELPDTPQAVAAQTEDHSIVVTEQSPAPGLSTNTMVLLISGLAAAGAVAWWWMGKQREDSPALAAASNPEEDEDEDEE